MLVEKRKIRLLMLSPGSSIADVHALQAIRPTNLAILSNDAITAALEIDDIFELETSVVEKSCQGVGPACRI